MLIKPEFKKIVLKLSEPERVLAVIPSAKTIEYKGHTLVVVPHRDAEVRILHNLGIEAPMPITYYYRWPKVGGKHNPFSHQVETASFLTRHSRAYCLDDMGCGKTAAVLWSYDYLRSIGELNKMLVVSPLSTLDETWGNTIFKTFPHLTFSILHGTRERRIKLLQEDVDIYVINHDGLKVIGDALANREDVNLVVIDEIAQVARNAGTDRWKALRKLVPHPKRRCWALTGTPTPNSPEDAWAQCKLVTPETVPTYRGKFRDMTMKQMGPYKWVPRPEATEIVAKAMSPAIRHKRDECIDLPPVTYETRSVELTAAQKAAYKTMLNKLHSDIDGTEITAVNEAVKVMKLVQIACIAYNTPVLTARGWVAIQDVAPADQVWDGVEWVRHGGPVYKGVRNVIECGGIWLTPEHEVLTNRGWKPAEELKNANASEGLNWAEVRLPNSIEPRRVYPRTDEVREVAMSMRVWEYGNAGESISAERLPYVPSELRVSPRQRNPQNVGDAPIPNLVRDKTKVYKSYGQRLEELRRAWNNRVRSVGALVRGVLGGHERGVLRHAHAGAEGQQRGVLEGKLSVGDPVRTGEQHPRECDSTNPGRPHDSGASCGAVRRKAWNNSREASTGMVCGEGANPSVAVFDIVNCGPRNRFVVRGKNGELRIVHNCGAVYGNDGETAFIPASSRLELTHEIIEEAGSKVIVFVPFTGALHAVSEYLTKKGHTVEVINGEVPKKERDRIFTAFQNHADPGVLVAQASAMSHGLTLTAASVIVWFAPVNSLETYEQACARITRPGQVHKQLVINIEGTPVERVMYERLQKKGKMQGLLLDAIKKGV